MNSLLEYIGIVDAMHWIMKLLVGSLIFLSVTLMGTKALAGIEVLLPQDGYSTEECVTDSLASMPQSCEPVELSCDEDEAD